jgi:FMN phosphatase YigB (HAD superfamily)
MVEKALGVEGDAILYVGDHIYTDAALAKLNFK